MRSYKYLVSLRNIYSCCLSFSLSLQWEREKERAREREIHPLRSRKIDSSVSIPLVWRQSIYKVCIYAARTRERSQEPHAPAPPSPKDQYTTRHDTTHSTVSGLITQATKQATNERNTANTTSTDKRDTIERTTSGRDVAGASQRRSLCAILRSLALSRFRASVDVRSLRGPRWVFRSVACILSALSALPHLSLALCLVSLPLRVRAVSSAHAAHRAAFSLSSVPRLEPLDSASLPLVYLFRSPSDAQRALWRTSALRCRAADRLCSWRCLR